MFPSLVVDTEIWLFPQLGLASEERNDLSLTHATSESATHQLKTVSGFATAFITYVLTGIAPELQLVFIPLGILVLLPLDKCCGCMSSCSLSCCSCSCFSCFKCSACCQRRKKRRREPVPKFPKKKRSDKLNGNVMENKLLNDLEEGGSNSHYDESMYQRLSKSQTTVV